VRSTEICPDNPTQTVTIKDASGATMMTADRPAAAVPGMIEMTTMAALGGVPLRVANAMKKGGS
jgi:hypothetical protein